MDTPSARTIIDDRGGYAVVAKALGLTPSTVNTWWIKDRLPPWRRDAVLALAKAENQTRPRRRRADQQEQAA